MHYSVTFCSRLEVAGTVISSTFVRLIVRNKAVKFSDPRLNRSQAIVTKVVEYGLVGVFFMLTADQRVASDTSYPVWFLTSRYPCEIE